ncbi:MAG: hypothetical protein PQJ46_10030 [Spirochaetales bacterium]|nr:hypothetical protein [Spirochaetales bacterium]
MNIDILMLETLNKFSRQNKKLDASFNELLDYINYLITSDEKGTYEVFLKNKIEIVTKKLKEFEANGTIKLAYKNGKIERIYNYNYINKVVKDAYDYVETNSEAPFPTTSSIRLLIPKSRLIPIHIPENLKLIMEDQENTTKLCELY